ncbi:hypothetical protein FA95DRAFT_1681748 [Auriscalpium vulgare]|uniref:Uncharacterized protein n=1 Tax=Auriscalpium vulgare TaxID=40419 RepID=A0ACB8RIE9_9AGAM|nr:hypothetical protein FA95DRAFT_1681748 [Auriscalpium vulgare]
MVDQSAPAPSPLSQTPSSRFLARKANASPLPQSNLLKAIRSALRGTNADSSQSHSVVYDRSGVTDAAPEELTWDNEKVVLSTGGVLKKQWDFVHEGQPVQWACMGWLEQNVFVAASRTSGHYTSEFHAGAPKPVDAAQKPTFGPFSRAEQERKRGIDPEAQVRATFVFLRSIGKIYLENGAEYTFSLPFIVRRAWPLFPHGILIQRVLDATEMQEAELAGDDILPTVFSLTSPLAEAAVVGQAAAIKGGFQSTPITLVHADQDATKPLPSIPPDELVIWASDRSHGEDLDLLVTVDAHRRSLSIWRYAYVKPHGPPLSQGHSRFRKKRTSIPTKRQSMAANDSFVWGAAQPVPDEHPFEKSPPPDLRELPPLSALPGMPPTLNSTTTMASLAAASPFSKQSDTTARADLSTTMDRMVLGGRVEGEPSLAPTDRVKMRATHWASRLHTFDISGIDASAWHKVNVAVFDQRYDCQTDRSLFAICLPASQTLRIFSLTKSQDKVVRIDSVAESSALAVAAMRITRENVHDLLVVKPTGTLLALTHGVYELPLMRPPKEESDIGPNGAPMDVDEAGPSSASDARATAPLQGVVSVKNVAGSTVTIVSNDGSETRITIDYMPKDLLTTQCLQVLAVTLPKECTYALYMSFIGEWSKRYFRISEGTEFECFSAALAHVFKLDPLQEAPVRLNAWERMASSQSAVRFADDPALGRLNLPLRPQKSIPAPLKRPHSYLAPTLNALHTLGEDLRLMMHRFQSVLRLSKLICRIAAVVRPEWVDYWKRFCPDATVGWVPSGLNPTYVDDRLPVWPSDMSAILYGRVSNPDWKLPWYDTRKLASQFRLSPGFDYGRVEPLAYLRQLTAVYRCLADKTVEDSRKRAENAMHLMVKSHVGSDFLNHLPLGLAAPLREVARTCQLAPGQDWPTSAYNFIGRNDLSEGAHSNAISTGTGYRTVKAFLSTNTRSSFRSLVQEAAIMAMGQLPASTGVESSTDDFTHIRFGQDKRLEEVARMLRSSEVPVVRMADRPDVPEHDMAKEQQLHVIRIAERTLALPLGRAMFTFASVPVVTREAYSIPKMEFSILLQPQNVSVSPEPNKIPPESLNWGDFHNGVAAALRIAPSSSIVDSSWIKFNKPSDLTPEHAGFLYGLGLTGHLKEMLTWHTFGYLTPKHDLTSIGVLLGLSAANVGSGNRHVTKLLAVHTPALLPTHTIDLNVPLVTQAAGLVGIGLLFMGSRNRRMGEVCLKQISRGDLLQPDISNEHREAYAMSAALAFGMVMLGKGSTPPIPADEALISELRVLVHGEAPSHFRGRRSRAAFDINLTSPAATIALGLMYLKTDSYEVADILTIPDTILSLNRIPPSFLLLRILAKCLIMWDAITPSPEWVTSQLPVSISSAMEGRSVGKAVDDAVELAYYNIVSGCCFAIALKYAGTAREEPYHLLINYYDTFSRWAYTNGPAYDHKIKRHAIRDGLNLISISLNIVMAGTGEINCLRRLRYSYGMYNQPMRYGTHMATHMSLGLLFLGGGRFTLGTSDAAVASMIAAFFPRFAPVSSDNKAYLQALRHLWVLAVEPRCLVARDVDTKEIVYLPVKIKVKDGGDVGMAQLIAPTLIPDFDRLLSIRVDTPRYWPFYLDLANVPRHKESLLRNQTIFVKRRTAFLSYLEDPKGSRSLFVRSGSSSGDAATLDFPRLTDTKAHPASDLNQFISSFSIDPFFLSFADHFCRDDGGTNAERLFNAYCHASLLDSILQDKPQTLQSHLLLYKYRTMVSSSPYFQLRLQDLRFAADFYSKVYERRFSGRGEGNARAPLIRDGTLSGALYALDQQLEHIRTEPGFLVTLGRYARGEPLTLSSSQDDEATVRTLAWYLLRNNVPVSTLLVLLQGLAQRANAHCISVPPPDGTADASALEGGIREVLHATGSQMTTTFGSGWSMRSLDEILITWRTYGAEDGLQAYHVLPTF